LKQRTPAASASRISATDFPTPEKSTRSARPPAAEHARELAAGNDVEARAQAREHVEDGEVGVRLHRVAHQVLRAREPLVELAVRRLDRGARIDVAGRAEARGDLLEGNAFQAQDAVDARERIHFDGAGGAGCAGGVSGSLSGPFCPQPAASTAAARAAAARARIIRAL
jgi:hypothetical protein